MVASAILGAGAGVGLALSGVLVWESVFNLEFLVDLVIVKVGMSRYGCVLFLQVRHQLEVIHIGLESCANVPASEGDGRKRVTCGLPYSVRDADGLNVRRTEVGSSKSL